MIWKQETYLAGNKEAARRSRQLRKLGFKVSTSPKELSQLKDSKPYCNGLQWNGGYDQWNVWLQTVTILSEDGNIPKPDFEVTDYRKNPYQTE